jgi:hypothetical protein
MHCHSSSMSLFYQSATDKENGDSVQIAKQGADNAAAELAQTQELRILVLKYVLAANEIRRRTEETQSRRVEGDKKILELKNEREQTEIKSAQLVRQYGRRFPETITRFPNNASYCVLSTNFRRMQHTRVQFSSSMSCAKATKFYCSSARRKTKRTALANARVLPAILASQSSSLSQRRLATESTRVWLSTKTWRAKRRSRVEQTLACPTLWRRARKKDGSPTIDSPQPPMKSTQSRAPFNKLRQMSSRSTRFVSATLGSEAQPFACSRVGRSFSSRPSQLSWPISARLRSSKRPTSQTLRSSTPSARASSRLLKSFRTKLTWRRARPSWAQTLRG